LVDRGLVKLEEKVRTYVPELKMKDEHAAANVTVLQLLNHTAGWPGDVFESFGDGDDALERFVSSMINLDQAIPLGSGFSYNNASLNVAGHVIAKVTGKTYEKAMQELIYSPLGLTDTCFFPVDVITRRFAVGHKQDPDGTIRIARPWALSRSGAPAGGFGVSATTADQIAWARFHMGDGTARDGTRVLSKELLDLMKEPTFLIPGSALGDAVGISWFIEDVAGTQTVSHGGDVIGQHSSFVMVPDRRFAVTVLTNCDDIGSKLKGDAVDWILEAYLGVVAPQPEPVKLPDDALAQYVGRYETHHAIADVTANDGALILQVELKKEAVKELFAEEEEIPDQPPFPMGILDGDGDRYVITDGPAKGMKGYFGRNESGEIASVHVGGRLAIKSGPIPATISSTSA
ncbi:MAG: serine hydrolase domain-containing protein, partial [Actinomycetota bacterium]